MSHKFILFVILPVSVWLLSSCAPVQPQASRPAIVIASPPSGSVYTLGEEVVVQSSASDAARILRVELLVDGVVVRQDSTPVATGQEQFSLLQKWTADRIGQRNLIVRATNAQGNVSETGISITVQETTAAPLNAPTNTPVAIPPTDAPTQTLLPLPTTNPAITVIVTATSAPTQSPTNTPTRIATTTTSSESAFCTDNSAFVADVTIPDGTNFAPNAAFTKTWRVRNTGTCNWQNYTLAFVSGAQMNGASVAVPATAVGATADISVPMTAPAAAGNYTGAWRLQNTAGAFLGTNVTVKINVPSPNAAANPTANLPASATATNTTIPPTLPAAATCSGQPANFTLTASKTTINAGQSVTLNWGAVSNASIAVLNGGQFNQQGVGAPGSITATPNTTTTYTLTATCNNGGGTRTNSVTVTVSANAAPPAACSGTPTIDSFTTSFATIPPGASVLLVWQTTNADQVRLTGGNLSGGVLAVNGSIFDQPAVSTIYRLSALCTANNNVVASQHTVNVVPCPSNAIGSFTASVNSITAGQSVTVSWDGIAEGNVVQLTAGDLPAAQVERSGSRTFSPNTTTTYLLKAGNSCPGAFFSTEKSVTVTVNAPACSGSIGNFFFHGSSGAVRDAQILTIKPGESVALEWGDITNADRIHFVGGGIDEDVGAPASRVVFPTAKTTYDLTASCSANNNSIHGSVTVDVKP